MRAGKLHRIGATPNLTQGGQDDGEAINHESLCGTFEKKQ